MNASKENAEKALITIMEICDDAGDNFRGTYNAKIIFIEDFIAAAKRKLPSEKSFPVTKKGQ